MKKITSLLFCMTLPIALIGQVLVDTNPGASTYDAVFVTGSNTVTMGDGTTLTVGAYATDNSTFNLVGGVSEGVFGFDSSTVNIIGGSVFVDGAFDNSVFNVSGGDVSIFAAYDASSINIWASSFGAGIGSGTYFLHDLAYYDETSNSAYLDLTFADGTSTDFLFFGSTDPEQQWSGSLTLHEIVPVPEPSEIGIMALFSLGIFLVVKRFRASRGPSREKAS